MCGFAGVIAWDEKYRITRDTLEKMSRAIAHRGPDGEGYHLTRENEPITPDTPQVGLAFRRLAILDPDPRSNQPFHIGPLTLVFNGEIYNFRDLKSEISKLRPDYAWRTTGDTEVLLMAYEVWREKCVEKLNGMFAFAIWDEQKKELFLARDRMGQKPLYQHTTPGAMLFCSETGAITASRLIQEDWNDFKLSTYLAYGYLPGSNQYQHGCQVPPATWMTVRPTHPDLFEKAEDYFPVSEAAPDRVITVNQVRAAVESAVARQLVSDVPLGIFLSGGIDSSIVAYCARKHGEQIKTFTVGFDDPRYDETAYARDVALHLQSDHCEMRVRPDAIHDLRQLARVFGEPFADSSALPTHYLARETKKNVKVAISGDGGDELFGGYDRYFAIKWSSRLRWLGPIASPVGSLLARGHPKSSITRAGRFMQSLWRSRFARYDSYLRIFNDRQLRLLLGDRARPPRVTGWLGPKHPFRLRADPVQAAMLEDRQRYLPNDLLTKVDRCSMMHGLEVRSPFMDHELVQFAAGLTTDQLLKGGPKRMLREAFAKDLPDFVFKRKKMGFAVPIGEWFRGELRPMLRDNLFAADSFGRSHFNMKVVERLVDEHEQQRVDHSQRLYALLMLELWWQQQQR